MKFLSLSMMCLLISLLELGCTQNKATNNQETDGELSEIEYFSHYENDYIAFDYPACMMITENENNMSDTLKSLKPGFTIEVYGELLPFSLKFVKSASFDVFENPEEWRDLSLQLKEMADSSYIGYIDKGDSLMFKGSPMAYATMCLKSDYSNDTITLHQVVVLRENKDLYYINYQALKDCFNEYIEVANEVINSIEFK